MTNMAIQATRRAINAHPANPFHPEYGIPHSVRIKVVADLSSGTVMQVAERHRVSTKSVYRWRKALGGEKAC